MAKDKVKFKRLTWMKIHGYISCFFLPIAFLYVVTGTLYMFDIHGQKIPTTYRDVNITAIPTVKFEADQFASVYLNQKQLSSNYYEYSYEDNIHYWVSLKHRYELGQDDKGQYFKYTVHDFWYQLVFIHKGHGGTLFTWFGILLGVSLFISMLSGTIIVLKTIPMKRQANIFMSVGFVALIIIYFIS